MDCHFPTISTETLRALVVAAHARGKLAVVHVGSLADAEAAMHAGADGLMHLFVDREPDANFGQAGGRSITPSWCRRLGCCLRSAARRRGSHFCDKTAMAAVSDAVGKGEPGCRAFRSTKQTDLPRCDGIDCGVAGGTCANPCRDRRTEPGNLVWREPSGRDRAFECSGIDTCRSIDGGDCGAGTRLSSGRSRQDRAWVAS